VTSFIVERFISDLTGFENRDLAPLYLYLCMVQDGIVFSNYQAAEKSEERIQLWRLSTLTYLTMEFAEMLTYEANANLNSK
jgi:hypothetical protein